MGNVVWDNCTMDEKYDRARELLDQMAKYQSFRQYVLSDAVRRELDDMGIISEISRSGGTTTVRLKVTTKCYEVGFFRVTDNFKGWVYLYPSKKTTAGCVKQ